MKKLKYFTLLCLISLALGNQMNAQDSFDKSELEVVMTTETVEIEETATEEEESAFDIGADIVSRYLWRGQLLATGPAFQPWASFSTDLGKNAGLEIGAWGSYGIAANDGTEADLYATLSLGPVGLTLTDYFFPTDALFAESSGNYFEYGDETGHVFELALSFDGTEKFPLTASVAYNVGGADPDNSFYVEVGYPFSDNLSVAILGGNGWYSFEEEEDKEDSFALAGVSLTYSKEIAITDKFSLPVFGTVMLNPNMERLFIVFGLSF